MRCRAGGIKAAVRMLRKKSRLRASNKTRRGLDAGNSTVHGVAALADTNGIGFTPLLAERTNCPRRDPSGGC
jgi:hypothetical protein